MKRELRSYASEDLTVEFDVKFRIHAEECAHGLPDVFNASL